MTTKIGVMVALLLLLGLVSTQGNAIADDDSKKPKTQKSVQKRNGPTLTACSARQCLA